MQRERSCLYMFALGIVKTYRFSTDQTRMWKYVWPFYAHAAHVYVSDAAQRGLIKFQLTKINALSYAGG